MENISWSYGVEGYFDSKEKELCKEIDELVTQINNHNKNISVVVSIEGGNQFHIKDSNGSLVGYVTAEQCKYALKGILVSILYL